LSQSFGIKLYCVTVAYSVQYSNMLYRFVA